MDPGLFCRNMTNIKSVILKLSVLTIQWILVYSASIIPALPHPYHRYSSVSSVPQSYQHYLIRIIVTHLYHQCLSRTSITSSVSLLLICIITASIIPVLPHPYHRQNQPLQTSCEAWQEPFQPTFLPHAFLPACL